MEIWLWINLTDATKQISKPTRDNYKAQYKHDRDLASSQAVSLMGSNLQTRRQNFTLEHWTWSQIPGYELKSVVYSSANFLGFLF